MFPTSLTVNRLQILSTTACVAALLPALACGVPASDCRVGAYRLADSSVVDIATADNGTLRWRKLDGTTGALHQVQPQTDSWSSTFGWTDRPDGKAVTFGPCEAGEIHFADMAGHRLNFDVTETKFHSHDVDLVGRLLLPKGRGRVPIVVLVHGSENVSARDSYALQRLLPAEGVGAFVYDKRGTGGSEGKYTQDFDVLADDVVAAMREARRISGRRAGRTGYQGGSQGGWVAPLAATRLPVDFVIVSFGLAVSVIDEDQQEVALEMRLKGHNPEEIAKALEVADAAEAVIESAFTTGFERFDAVRAKYRNESWYKDVHGNYTYLLLPYNEAELREKGKAYIFGTPFRYDPMPTLRAVNTAQLWILGEDDLEAPSAETSRRIKTLIADGRPMTLALYPGAEHGMTEYETRPDGERVSTRFSPGYFAMMRDFARTGRLQGPYGSSVVTGPELGH
jgi:pimeloyl-ACP methyl ester carboxylesterase